MTLSNDVHTKFSFLDSQMEKEAYIFDVLALIDGRQNQYLSTRQGSLMTFNELVQSRSLKMADGPVRTRMIQYLTDSLVKRYPQHVKILPSFNFSVNKDTKKMSITESVEFAVDMQDDVFASVKKERDGMTKKNFLAFLAMFRLLNISKLKKGTPNGPFLIELISEENGKTLYTFKHYSLGKRQTEIAEDFCFHKDNYEAVVASLPLNDIKKIARLHGAAIIRQLKSFGITGIEVSDYRDTKLDYIINALLTNVADQRDIITVKNFDSLRKCLMEAGESLNPLIAAAGDIALYIKDNAICTAEEIAAVFPNVTKESVESWEEDDLLKKRIIRHKDPTGALYFIDAKAIANRINDLHKRIVAEKSAFNALNRSEKGKLIASMDMICGAAKDLLNKGGKQSILGSEQTVQIMVKKIKEYEGRKAALLESENKEAAEQEEPEEKPSLVKRIVNFFLSFFFGGRHGKVGGGEREDSKHSSAYRKGARKKQRSFSKVTKDIYQQLKDKRAPLIPLSDYIELTDNNSKTIDTIIDELRDNDLKVVVPIYNARKNLYPIRSQDYIISDIEYLLVPTSAISTADAVRDFADSLTGYKLKDEPLPVSGLLAIENYLLTVYRQNKARERARRAATKSSLNKEHGDEERD